MQDLWSVITFDVSHAAVLFVIATQGCRQNWHVLTTLGARGCIRCKIAQGSSMRLDFASAQGLKRFVAFQGRSVRYCYWEKHYMQLIAN